MAKKPAGFRKTTQRSKSVDKFVEDAGRDPFGDTQAPQPAAPAVADEAPPILPAGQRLKPYRPEAQSEDDDEDPDAWRFADPGEKKAHKVFNLRLNRFEVGLLGYVSDLHGMSKHEVVKAILMPALRSLGGVDTGKK